MPLLLIRHAKTAASRPGAWQGDIDVPLAEDANVQLVALAGRCARLPIHRVLASPLTRTVETAKAVSEACKVRIETTDDLREMRLGAFEGLTLGEMEARFPEAFRAYITDTVNVAPPGGEPFATMQRRVVAFAHALAAVDELIVLVTHTGPILALVCAALRLDPRERVRLQPAACSLSRLQYKADEFVLQSFNDVAHLE